MQGFLNSKNYVSANILASVRVLFGFMMLISMGRFFVYDWIYLLYIKPKFFFSYYGLHWIKPIGEYTYLLFIICFVSSFMIMIGYKYKVAIVLFFLSFFYIECMDVTNYLNHYYFIVLLSFIMIFLPMNAAHSWDARKKNHIPKVPVGYIRLLQIMIGLVYFYAGLWKLNSDWLWEAQPMKIWMESKFNLPLIGRWAEEKWLPYAFSWAGALYDLSIPFLLYHSKTRPYAFVSVLIFHVLTWYLFPIGIFPFVMIVCTLVFFSEEWHNRLWHYIDKKGNKTRTLSSEPLCYPKKLQPVMNLIFGIFIGVQLLFPWRYLLYPGELFWTEEGYRFSWRVMLMEKTGYAQFYVRDPKTGISYIVHNDEFLSPTQEKQMSTQPDLILQFAHHIEKEYRKKGIAQPEVYAEVTVALNGRPSQPFILKNINLTHEKESFLPKTWIYPFKGTIQGL